jgi:hypothetical protein
MKKLLLSLLIIPAAFSFSSAQTIPNASFENWHQYQSNGKYPDSWMTSDSIAVNNGGGNNVYDSTDAFDGNLSMHMKSVTIILFGSFPVKGPGIATNGQIQVNLIAGTINFSGGSSDTSRSRFFTMQYKYLPLTGTNDAATVNVIKYRYNSSTALRDTIAIGFTEITGTHDVYEQLTLPLTYKDFINQPDTTLIILQSSRGINDPDLGVGTQFIVDSLNFSGFVGIDELKSAITAVNVYPSPANDFLNLDVVLKNNFSISYGIFDLNGRLIKSASMKTTKETIDVSDLANGKYIITIGDSKLNQLYSTNFSILR